jgi:hypothetical protein
MSNLPFEDNTEPVTKVTTATSGQQATADSSALGAHTEKPTNGKISRLNLTNLKAEFNRHMYTASESNTRLQLGPITYGAEVQGIQILENKAVHVIQGVRTGSDYLIDGGNGDADVQVTLLFSGTQHVKKALRPLLALFRIAPIIGVRNEAISGALYSKFTEDTASSPVKELLQIAVDSTIDELRRSRINQIIAAYGREGDTTITFETYIKAVQQDDPSVKGFLETQYDYQQFIGKTVSDAGIEERLGLSATPEQLRDISGKAGDVLSKVEKIRQENIDFTNNVPMAFVGLEMQTHPEMSSSIIVTLMLKRIDISNFLSDNFQYMDVEGNATTEPDDAFWLNRAIDLYIDRNLPDTLIEDISFSDLKMSYVGDNVELRQFKRSNDLKAFTISANKGDNHTKKTSVTQLNYSVFNKFNFMKLIGRAYPTAQHMGTTSGTLSVNISTASEEDYSLLHTYKAAADFFVRNTERYNRLNGWEVNCAFTKLTGFNPRGLAESPDEPMPNRSYYPTRVVSSTDDQQPGLKHITIEFQETNPEFFNDFGFSIKKGGYDLNILYDFYKQTFENAEIVRKSLATTINKIPNPGEVNLSSYRLFYGDGDTDNSIMMFNPDTIIAALLEPMLYSKESSKYEYETELQYKLLSALDNNDLVSGLLETTGQRYDVFWDNIKSISIIFDSIEIPRDLATEIVEEYFTFKSEISKRYLINRIVKIGEKSIREDLYQDIIASNNIGLSDSFVNKLFTALARRREITALSEIYDRGGVVRGFHALALGIETKGEEVLGEAAMAPLVKRGSIEDKVILGTDGRLKLDTESLTTCYSDFFYITYDELFNLPGTQYEDPSNWTKYAPRYRNLGIVHFDEKLIKEGGLSEDTVNSMQNQLAALINGPVSPSVFFYREDELHEMTTSLEEENNQWQGKLKSLVLDMSFDIEKLIRDENGNYVGLNSSAYSRKEMSSILDEMIDSSNSGKLEDARSSLILNEIASQIQKGEISEDELFRKARSGTLGQEFFDKISWFTAAAEDGISVPYQLGSTKNSPTARYEKLAGVSGKTLARKIVYGKNIQNARDEAFQDFVTSTIVKSAASGINSPRISNATSDEAHASFLKITQAMADDRNSMSRAYPVMRLYLIEDAGPSLIVQDNFYGYHAIESIDITLDKYDADLAVIRIADPFHLLQGSAFSIDDKYALNDKLALPSNGEFDESILQRMELKQGRAIQIRGGYSADPDHLDILFTGRVAELQFGDVITVVAQGWKVELMGSHVEFELQSKTNSSVKDLIVRTVRDANPKGIGEVYGHQEYETLKKLTPHINAKEQLTIAEIVGRGTTGGSSGAPGASWSFLRWKWENVDAGVDLRLRNVWVPDIDSKDMLYFKDILSHGWQGSHWVVPLTPAWDVLQNAVKYTWGNICQVVPYDGEATLFIGKPEQLYFHTRGDKKVKKALNTARTKASKEVEKAMQELMSSFIKSESFRDVTSSGTKEGLSRQYYASSYNTDLFTDELYLYSMADNGYFGHSWGYFGVGTTRYKKQGASSYKEYERLLNNTRSYFLDASAGALQSVVDKREESQIFGTGGRYDADNYYRHNLKKDIYSQDFSVIRDTFGGLDKASRLMFSSFYGTDPVQLGLSISNISNLIELMLKPVSNGSFVEYREKIFIVSVNMNIDILLTPEANNAIYSSIAEKISDLSIVKARVSNEDLNEYLANTGIFFRAFIHYFAEYLRKTGGQVMEENQLDAIESIKKSSAFDTRFISDMKVFRDYHYVTDKRDILSNDLAASTREMYNTVVVRYPKELVTSNNSSIVPDFIEEFFNGDADSVEISAETQWTSYPQSSDGHVGMQFNDQITLENKKVVVHTDLNVSRPEQAALVGTHVLAESMRSMYRNKITILGRAIKPWDYVLVNDKYTDMYGFIDVERVVHHYSAQEGWVTNVIPHAVCEANPGNRTVQAAMWASRADRVLSTLDYVSNAILIASFVPAGLAVGALRAEVTSAFKAAAEESLLAGGKNVLQSVAVRGSLEIVKDQLLSNSVSFAIKYVLLEGVEAVSQYTTRLIHENMRSRDSNLPIVFTPILFKGRPLTAGMSSSNSAYYSLGSKLHWSFQHMWDGLGDLMKEISGQKEIKSNLQRRLDAVVSEDLNNE